MTTLIKVTLHVINKSIQIIKTLKMMERSTCDDPLAVDILVLQVQVCGRMITHKEHEYMCMRHIYIYIYMDENR